MSTLPSVAPPVGRFRSASPAPTAGPSSSETRFRSTPSISEAIPDLIIGQHKTSLASDADIAAIRQRLSRSPSPIAGDPSRLARSPSPAATDAYMDLLNIPGAVTFERSRLAQRELSGLEQDVVDQLRRNRSPSPVHIESTSLLPIPRPFRLRAYGSASDGEGAGPEPTSPGAGGGASLPSTPTTPTRAASPLARAASPLSPSRPASSAGPAAASAAGAAGGGGGGDGAVGPTVLRQKKLKDLTPVELRRMSRVFLVSTKFKLTDEEETMIARQYKTEAGSLDGSMSCAVFQAAMSVWGVPQPMIRFLFDAFDRDGSHTIEFDEFCNALSVYLRGSFDDKVRFFFTIWDTDNSGTLSKDEVRSMLQVAAEVAPGTEGVLDEAERLLDTLDTDRSGEVSFVEFLRGVHRLPRLNTLFHQCFGDL